MLLLVLTETAAEVFGSSGRTDAGSPNSVQELAGWVFVTINSSRIHPSGEEIRRLRLGQRERSKKDGRQRSSR